MSELHLKSFVTFAGLTLALAGAQAQDTLKVVIGHVGPTSGPAAHLGKDNLNGAQLAIDDLNARGIKLNGKSARFELKAQDDVADPKQAVQIAQMMCDSKVNGVVGHLTSGTSIPAARVYSDCNIPMVSPVATNPRLTQLGYKNIFRLLSNDNVTGAALANWTVDKLKLSKVAVIDDRTSYGQGVADAYRKTAEQRGLKIVANEYTNDKAADFTAVLTKVKSTGAEVIFYGGLDTQAGPILRQMQQLGMTKVKLLGGDGMCTPKVAELAGSAEAAAAVVCAEGGVSIEKMPGGLAWKQRYEARFPGEFQGNAPYGYDAVMAVGLAMQAAGSADPAVYAAKLYSTQAPGVTGTLAFDAQGEMRNPAFTVSHFPGSKKTPLN